MPNSSQCCFQRTSNQKLTVCQRLSEKGASGCLVFQALSQLSAPPRQLLHQPLLPDCLSNCFDPNMESCSQLLVLLGLRSPAKCMALKSRKTLIKCCLNAGNCTSLYIAPALFCLLIRTTWKTISLTNAQEPCGRNPASAVLGPESQYLSSVLPQGKSRKQTRCCTTDILGGR